MPMIGQNRQPNPTTPTGWVRGLVNQGATTGPGGTLNGRQVHQATTAQVPATPHVQQTSAANGPAALHHAQADTWTAAAPQAAKTLADGIWRSPRQPANEQWKEVDPKKLNRSDRFATSFAYATDLVKSYEGKNTGTFQRENNLLSGIAKTMNGDAIPTLATSAAKKFVKGNYAVDMTSYGLAMQNGKPDVQKANAAFGMDKLSDKKFAEKTREMTAESVRVLDEVMCETFGTPGDADSAHEAVKKFPVDLCTHYAIICKAIDNGNHSDVDKTAMKKNAGRDIFVLRTLIPQMNAAETTEKVGADANGKTSITKMSKAVQSLCNGQGLSQNNAHPEADRMAGPGFAARWSSGFDAFCEAAVARADQGHVADAVRHGQDILSLRP